MATYGRTMRRGLPRLSGGEPWPSEATIPAEPYDGAIQEPAAQTATRPIRRGLPRTAGGEPWPLSGDLPATVQSASTVPTAEEAGTAPASALEPVEQAEKVTVAAPANEPAPQPERTGTAPAAAVATGAPQLLRRGLPRVPGGESWPTEAAVAVEPAATPAAVATAPALTSERAAPSEPAPSEPAPSEPVLSEPAPDKPAATQPVPESRPAASDPSGSDSQAAAREEAEVPAREDHANVAQTAKGRSRAVNLLLGAMGLLVVALAAVFFTRWFVTLGFMQDFLIRYPGETHLPDGADPGFPAWVQWQHFFNFFLIVLIIRSGLQVRRETRPPGYWTPRWSKGGSGKISINLWFHQALDLLWLLNGLVFVVLLFITGHWVRLVPTTWEVLPNALSALIQYVSLDWPTENGWVNYNSLQMLAYFATVFIAAPLAAISGARMSGIWPKDAKTLNRIYPVEWARAVHFPVMLYFVVFIIGHVALVFATGALRNLNHMYAGQDVVNWAGFWIFFGSLLLTVGAWVAARPVVLAPIAGLSGRVSSR